MPRLPKAQRNEVLTETRGCLLEAAAEEFAQKGFAGANINRISTAAGFAKGTIYNYFPSKRSLMLALIDEIAAEHTDFITTQVEAEEYPTQRLKRFFNAGFTFVERLPAKARVAINVVFGHDNEFKGRMFQAYEDLFGMITEEIIEAGMSRGDFKQTDSDLTTALIMSLYLGSCSLLDSDGKIWIRPEQVTNFVMEGLQQQGNWGKKNCEHDGQRGGE